MIGPFWPRHGGGCQEINTVSGSVVFTVTLTGDKLGALFFYEKKKKEIIIDIVTSTDSRMIR